MLLGLAIDLSATSFIGGDVSTDQGATTNLLMETGDRLLLEDGDAILMES